MFVLPEAHSRATGMNVRVYGVAGYGDGQSGVQHGHHQPRVNVVDDGEGEADRPFFLLVGITVPWRGAPGAPCDRGAVSRCQGQPLDSAPPINYVF